MKLKWLLGMLVSLVLFVTSGTAVMAEDEISVTLDGEYLAFDVPPQIINNRTMLPARAIIEAIGAEVSWNESTQTVTATKEDKTVSFVINQPIMRVDKMNIALDAPACIVGDRTLVPVRALSTAFNMTVDWDEKTRTVSLLTTEGLLKRLEKVPPYPEYAPNTEAFEKVKNKIIAEGVYSDDCYCIDIVTNNTDELYVSMSLLYYPDTDTISWGVFGSEGTMVIDAFYSIYNQPEYSPSVMAGIMNNGVEYSKYGIFMSSTHLLKTLESDIPQDYVSLVDEWIVISADAFDQLMTSYNMDITMEDFGIAVDGDVYQ